METKTFKATLNFKTDGQPGEFEAVFATLNVVDLDGDVTLPGAFGQQKVLIEPWNHNDEAPPVGKGQISENENEAVVNGRFFLDTQAGKDHYTVAKELEELQEFSYSFHIKDAEPGMFGGERVRFLKKMDVIGVGQVSRGAGIATRLTNIKSDQKRAIAPRSTPTTDVAWDGPANEARLRNDGDAAYYRRAFAWVDPEGDPNVKASYKFIHHMVDGDGNIGAANVRGCSNGIGVLNGGRGGTVIPEADRQGVYNHLARHLRDAEMEPPELKSIEDETAGGGKSSEDINTEISLAELGQLMRRLEIEQ